MSEGALFEELKDEFHPPLSPTLIATLLLDYDPDVPTSLDTIRSSLLVLSEETQDPEPYFYPSDSDDGGERDEEAEVQRMLERWSLTSSSAASAGGADWPSELEGGTSSNGTSVSTASSRDDSLDFLRMLFPYTSTTVLQEAYDDCASGDMTAVVEHLLSVEAIREAEATGDWNDPVVVSVLPPDEPRSQEDQDRLWEFGRAQAAEALDAPLRRSKSASFKGSTTKKAKKLAKTTAAVGGLPTGVLVRPTASPATSTRSLNTPATDKGKKPAEGSNAWVAISSIASSLADILAPASPEASTAHFNSYLHSSGPSSSYSNVLSSLKALNQPLPDTPTDYLSMLVLADEAPSKREREVLDIVWTASAGQVDTALNLWALLENVKERSGDPQPRNGGLFVPSVAPAATARKSAPGSPALRPTSLSAPPSPVLSRSKPVLSAHLHPISRNLPSQPTSIPLPPSPVIPSGKLKGGFQVPHGRAQRSKFAPSSKPVQLHPLAESIPAYKGAGVAVARDLAAGKTTSKKGGMMALREREARERRMRDEALRSACRYYTAGNAANQGRSIAAHYAEQARKHSEVLRAIGLEAARDHVYHSPRTTPTGIDLHGLDLYQATHVVSDNVNAWWANTTLRSTPFTIITGKGLHSSQARAVLRPAISRQLKEAGWRVSEGTEGALRVIGRV